MIIGYTSGVFDLFHVGHINILRSARSMCDKLIVGVSTDELVGYKNKRAVIPFVERIDVVRACRYVDVAIPQETMDKRQAWDRYKFDVMFVGDDWFATERWKELDAEFCTLGVRIIYFPYTKGTSSTLINDTLERLRAS
ncbi:MAG: glycerol-3-phosphate cytidylyltransferase [Rhodocyclaceae bacterium]|nr:glycerol-3-phosphate cytidylyltransferase [Rhodocyclaceae bacterium]